MQEWKFTTGLLWWIKREVPFHITANRGPRIALRHPLSQYGRCILFLRLLRKIISVMKCGVKTKDSAMIWITKCFYRDITMLAAEPRTQKNIQNCKLVSHTSVPDHRTWWQKYCCTLRALQMMICKLRGFMQCEYLLSHESQDFWEGRMRCMDMKFGRYFIVL